jgi:hypothetical protein
MEDENPLFDFPSEFLTSLTTADGVCEAQSILPEGDHYLGHCTCGRWDVIAASQDEGVEMARRHTGSLS